MDDQLSRGSEGGGQGKEVQESSFTYLSFREGTGTPLYSAWAVTIAASVLALYCPKGRYNWAQGSAPTLATSCRAHVLLGSWVSVAFDELRWYLMDRS